MTLKAKVGLGAMMAAGAVGGFFAGLVTDGFKGGLRGMASGGLFGGVTGYYRMAYNLERVIVTSMVGGIASEIQGGRFKDGMRIAGVISLMTWSALKMREHQWENSNLYVDPDSGSRPNASGESVGFRGDDIKLGGGRREVIGHRPDGTPITVPTNPPLGGPQGRAGRFFWIPYKPGSFLDHVVESYAGVHDFLNWPTGYGPYGNYYPAGSMVGRFIHSGHPVPMNT